MKYLFLLVRTALLALFVFFMPYILAIATISEALGIIQQVDEYGRPIIIGTLLVSLLSALGFQRSKYRHFPVFSGCAVTGFLGMFFAIAGFFLIGADGPEAVTWHYYLFPLIPALAITILLMGAKGESFTYTFVGDETGPKQGKLGAYGVHLDGHTLEYRDIEQVLAREEKLVLRWKEGTPVPEKWLMGRGSERFLEVIPHHGPTGPAKEIQRRSAFALREESHTESWWGMILVEVALIFTTLYYLTYVLTIPVELNRAALPWWSLYILYNLLMWDMYFLLQVPNSHCRWRIFPLFWRGETAWGNPEARGHRALAWLIRDLRVQLALIFCVPAVFLGMAGMGLEEIKYFIMPMMAVCAGGFIHYALYFEKTKNQELAEEQKRASGR